MRKTSLWFCSTIFWAVGLFRMLPLYRGSIIFCFCAFPSATHAVQQSGPLWGSAMWSGANGQWKTCAGAVHLSSHPAHQWVSLATQASLKECEIPQGIGASKGLHPLAWRTLGFISSSSLFLERQNDHLINLTCIVISCYLANLTTCKANTLQSQSSQC